MDREKAKSELASVFERVSRPRDGGKTEISGNVVIGNGNHVSQVNVYPRRRRAKRPLPAKEELRRDMLGAVIARAEKLGLVDDQVRVVAEKILRRDVARLDLLALQDLAQIYSELMSMRRPAAE